MLNGRYNTTMISFHMILPCIMGRNLLYIKLTV